MKTHFILLLCCVALLTSAASANVLGIENGEVTTVGGTASVNLVLDEAPAGLLEYSINVTISNPGIATISAVSYPPWATLPDTSPLPAAQCQLKASDAGGAVEANATNVTLATVTIQGLADGETTVNLAVNKLKDDSDTTISPSIAPGMFSVNIPGAPHAAFTTDNQTGPAPLTVHFTDQSTGATPITYAWDFNNDGVVDSTDQNPSYLYPVRGLYSVNLTITNAIGTNSTRKTGYINVTGTRTWTVGASMCDYTEIPPAISNTAMQAGDTVFVYNGTYITDSGTSATQNVPITLKGEGTNLVTWSKRGGVTLNGPGSIVEGFTFTVPSGLGNYELAMCGSNSLVRDCIFDGGGGVYLLRVAAPRVTVENVTFRNTWIGQYSSALGLTSNNCMVRNCTFSNIPNGYALSVYKSVFNTIENNTFTSSRYGVQLDQPETTDNTLTNNTFTGITGYGGVVFNAAGPNNHVYLNNFIANGQDVAFFAGVPSGTTFVTPAPVDYTYLGGTYTGVLGNYWDKYTGTDTDGNGIGDAQYNYDPAPLMDRTRYYLGAVHSPITSVTITPATAAMDLTGTVQFTAKAFDQEGMNIPCRVFSWSSSNGTVGTVNQTGFFSPLAPGRTTITALNATVSNTAATTVVVDPPVAGFSGAPKVGSAPLTVQFNDTSENYPTDWSWTFGDGGISTQQNPLYTYPSYGTFPVTLTVTSMKGTSSVSKPSYVTVLPNGSLVPPDAGFTASVSSGVAPLYVRFTDTSTGSPTIWSWTFGDGGTSTLQNPTHTFMAEGTYLVALTATNGGGSTIEVQSITVTTSDGGVARTSWPMAGHDPQNTGRSEYTGAQSAVLKWTYTTGGTIQHSSPVIGADGTIYIGNYQDKKVYAIYPNGTLRWTYQTGNYLYGSPAVGSDGTIYIGNYQDNKLYAINPNGTLKWTYASGGNIYYGSPAIGTDNTIYFGCNDKKIYALYPNGTLKWSYLTGGYIRSAPAIGLDGTIYSGSYDKNVYALNPDGSLKWTYTTGGAIQYSSPVIGADGTIHITSGDKKIYALNPDGTLRWSYLTGGNIQSSPAIGPDGTIYSGNYGDKKVYALNPNGTLKWYYQTGGSIYGRPVVGSDGTVYVTNYGDFRIYALSPEGTLKWSYLTGGTIYSSIAIGPDGSVYVGVTGEKKVYAFAGPVDFTANRTGGNSPLAVQFTCTSPLTVTGYRWSFGDGATSTEANPSHTYTALGNYSVNLTITHANGTNTITKTDYIVLSTPVAPVAQFNAAPMAGTAPLAVRFTDTSTGYPTEWAWDFGDGDSTNATDQNPVHTFSSAGIYTINLTVTNSMGSSNTTRAGYITVTNAAAGASFMASPRSGTAPLSVQFNDTSAGGALSSWNWSFGDNEWWNTTDAAQRNMTHTYAAPGSYTATLTVSNTGGSSTTVPGTVITVTGGPAASFTFSPASGYEPLEVQFNDTSVCDPLTNITGWDWSFDGGGNWTNITSPALRNVTNIFQAAGTYNVILSVTDGNGAVGSTNRTITVTPLTAPAVDFSASPTTGIAPLTVTFTDNSSGWVTSRLWDFGDGSTDTVVNPVHTYTLPGSFTVNLTGTGPGGSTRKYIAVNVTEALTVTGMSPGTGIVGKVVPVKLTGTNITAGSGVSLVKGSEVIAATDIVLTGNTKIGCTFTIPWTATSGQYDVVVTNTDGKTGTLVSGFLILDRPVPVIKSLTPASMYPNGTWSFTLTGENFQGGSTVVFNRTGAGPLPAVVTVTTSTQLNGTLTVPASVATGSYDVIVTSPDTGSGTKQNILTIVSLQAPALTGLSPSTVFKNSTTNVVLSGNYFQPGLTTVYFDAPGLPDIPLSNLTVVNQKKITGTISVPGGAVDGKYNAVVSTPDGGVTVKTNTLTVKPWSPPRVGSVMPTKAFINGTSAFTISGSNFEPGATVAFTRTGSSNLIADSLTVVSLTKMTGYLTIPPGTTADKWDLVVTTPDGGPATKTKALQVMNWPLPRITKVTPMTGAMGTPVSFTVTGSNFQPGATAVVFNKTGSPDVPATAVTVTSQAQLTGTVTLPAIGKWNLLVTTADGGTSVKKNAFTAT